MPAPFLDISGYLDRPDDLQPSLAENLQADVVIIGGGFTGLSTALALKSEGMDVVLLEREFCGFGASGRNAGHLTPTIGKDLPTLIMMYGAERTGTLVRFAEHCVRRTQQLITDREIACDYHDGGNIMTVVHPSQEKRLRRGAEAARKLGASMTYLDAQAMRERSLPHQFIGGVFEPVGGTLHPGKLVLGLRKAALAAGVRIYEQTPALAVLQDARPIVYTPAGQVKAEHVVLGSNAYTREVSAAGKRLVPLYVSMFETEVLSDEQRAAIGGWTGREGVYTAHEILESYRLSASGSIIGGSRGVRYYYGGTPKPGVGAHAATRALQMNAFGDRFPELRHIPMQHHWGGWIAMTLNFLPAIGPVDKSGKVLQGVGYNGHGIAQANAVGELLADRILGRKNEWADVLPNTPPPLPPEPLLWLVSKALLASFALVDRRTDKRIRKLAAR